MHVNNQQSALNEFRTDRKRPHIYMDYLIAVESDFYLTDFDLVNQN